MGRREQGYAPCFLPVVFACTLSAHAMPRRVNGAVQYGDSSAWPRRTQAAHAIAPRGREVG